MNPENVILVECDFEDLRAEKVLGTPCDFWRPPKGGPDPRLGTTAIEDPDYCPPGVVRPPRNAGSHRNQPPH